jgi:hypothetical protein
MRCRSRCARLAPLRAPTRACIFLASLFVVVIVVSCGTAGAADAPPAGVSANTSTAALSHEARARAALADAPLPAPLAAALVSLGMQLDACGSGDDDAAAGDVTTYMDATGGMARIAEDVRDIAGAARRCAVSSDDIAHASAAPPTNATAAPGFALWSTHSRAASEALRERMRDLGHHLKFVRALVTPCVMEKPDDAPPVESGAWALNAWLRGAREVLETRRGCLARGGDALMAAAAAPTCGCARAVGIAAATTFISTAAVAAALGAVMRRRAAPWTVVVPRRRLRGTAALGMSSSAGGAADADALVKKRHSLSGPELPRPYGAVPAPSRNGAPV